MIITNAQEFFIELSGGVILQAGDFLDEPLLELIAFLQVREIIAA